MFSKVRINGFLGCAILGSALLISACDADVTPIALRNLDRPSEVAFACYGQLQVESGTVVSAQDMSACIDPPEGLTQNPAVYGFVLQPARGTLAVVNDGFGVSDSDPLTPGLNHIPVGTLPVGLVTDNSSCHVMTANSGSCDISVVDINSALDLVETAKVSRKSITTPAGAAFLSRPRTIVTGPKSGASAAVCPEAPTGLVYVAYPACHMVAAVEAASGSIQSALVFGEDGAASLATAEDFAACPLECGDGTGGTVATPSGARPVALEVAEDGSALYIGDASTSVFSIAALDDNGLPTAAVQQVTLEGDVGISNIAISGAIEMGGNLQKPTAPSAGQYRFAYGVGSDSTIRVIDLVNLQECDTQVDPRYLLTETDLDFLACMPVGDVRTPPRRAGARGPGITLSSMSKDPVVPLDVSFVSFSSEADAEVTPKTLLGTFAVVSTTDGKVYIVNVDDDNYADVELPGDPVAVSMPLALAHQVRDSVADRDALAVDCASPSGSAGARLAGAPSQFVDSSFVAPSKIHELPFFRGVTCEANVDGIASTNVISELAFSASAETRETAFPDLRHVEDQRWDMVWEGTLSLDSVNQAIDGPVVRNGVVTRSDNAMRIEDGTSPFCRMGVEPYDIVTFVGCNTVNSTCGVGEECFVHPSSRSQQSGVCVLRDQVEELSETCKDFFTSEQRNYSVDSSNKDALGLIERRRVLRTSPLDGCTSVDQCEIAAAQEAQLASSAHPIDADDFVSEYSWVCEADPSRSPGVDRCVMSCTATADCERGFACSAGRCVEAALPPEQCLRTVQRYRLSAGEAFTIIGSVTGYLHSIIADPTTGACVEDSNRHPLNQGRLSLRPPACDDDNDANTGPNPCATVVEHTEEVDVYSVVDGTCGERTTVTRTRDAQAVRFSNPSMSFHLVDTETNGDLNCINDQLGTVAAFATPHHDYQVRLAIAGGFSSMILPIPTTLPIRMTLGPLGKMWIVDQGDSFSNNGVNRGRLLVVDIEKQSLLHSVL